MGLNQRGAGGRLDRALDAMERTLVSSLCAVGSHSSVLNRTVSSVSKAHWLLGGEQIVGTSWGTIV